MALTDGIFGMVITLLAFVVALPEVPIATITHMLNFIQSLFPTLGTVIVSIIISSVFWIYHHEFIKLKSLDISLLWITILYLAGISFIPFFTSLIGQYGQFISAEIVFGANVFVALMLFMVMLEYAHHKKYIETRGGQQRIYVRNTFIMIIFFTLLVIIGDLLISPYCTYLFLLIPIISTIRDVSYKIKSVDSK